MRTTLNLDPDVLAAAKRIAQARSMPLGDVISALAATGLEVQAQARVRRGKGFPVFAASPTAPVFGLEHVKRDEDAGPNG